MQLTTDFETGSGRLSQLAPAHWRLDTVADVFGYNRYFCVRVHNEADHPQELRLEIHPAPEFGTRSHFMTHFPSHLWYGEADGYRWRPLRHTWEDAVRFHADHVEVRLPLEPGQSAVLATNVPLPYSHLRDWIAQLQRQSADAVRLESLGSSLEGRDIPILRLGTTGRPRLLVLGGMHSSEHSGVFGCQGIAEYLCTRIREARRLAANFDITVIPMLNPDGNVHGYSGGTTERLPVNNSMDFKDAADGASPRTHENRLLWRWLCDQFQPEYCLHFHAYLGWKRNADPPYDGLFVLEDPAALLSPPRLAQHQAIVDRLRFETPAFSAHWGITGTLSPDMFEYQLARRFETISMLYEINAGSVGPSEQFRRGPQILTALTRALLEDMGG